MSVSWIPVWFPQRSPSLFLPQRKACVMGQVRILVTRHEMVTEMREARCCHSPRLLLTHACSSYTGRGGGAWPGVMVAELGIRQGAQRYGRVLYFQALPGQDDMDFAVDIAVKVFLPSLSQDSTCFRRWALNTTYT